MKPTDVFCAILKAYGVIFWVYALEEIPGAIRYSTYFIKSHPEIENYGAGINAYW